MIMSRSGVYAVQALLMLATHENRDFVVSGDIAAHLGLPRAYLSKLMQLFAHADIVESSRGRFGGFRLHRDPDHLFLREIMEIANGERQMKECLLGFKECSDETACALHCQWRPVKLSLLKLLEEQSIGDLAKAVKQGKYRLSELNPDGLGKILSGAN